MEAKNIDPKYIGVPNICFSLTDPNDSREPEFSKQRIERGFDSSELWSLRDTIGNFILPRLKAFIPKKEDVVLRDKKYYRDLNRAVKAFELLTRDGGTFLLTKQETRQYKRGMVAYHKLFLSLWY